jgi:hypothetical protein
MSDNRYSNGYGEGFEDGRKSGMQEVYSVSLQVSIMQHQKIEFWKQHIQNAINELRDVDPGNPVALDLEEWLLDDMEDRPERPSKEQIRHWWMK